MLLRVILKNILSYREEVQFDMFPNIKRKILSDHIYAGEIPLLKQSAVYGGNGSGKSNLINALWFIQQFATNSEFLQKADTSRYFHLLSANNEVRNIEFLVEFVKDDHYYIYDVSISREKVERETLRTSGLGRKQGKKVFERTSDSINFPETPQTPIKKILNDMVKKNPLSSFFSLNFRVPIIDSLDIKRSIEWFTNDLIVVPMYSKIPPIINMMYKDKGLLAFTRSTFNRIGLGIEDLNVRYSPIEEYLQRHLQVDEDLQTTSILDELSANRGITAFRANKPVVDIILENGMKKAGEMIFMQQGEKGNLFEMDMPCQSDGTIRLLMLMPIFYNISRRDATVFVDEINQPIHPLLIKRLIKVFANDKTSKGQLIFTTHEVELLDNSFMRPDEVWFASKNHGATTLYSLNEFKLHANISMKIGYLEGRFGGVPQIKGNRDAKDELHEEARS